MDASVQASIQTAATKVTNIGYPLSSAASVDHPQGEFFVFVSGIFPNIVEKYKKLSTFVKMYNLQNKENVVIYTYRNG